MPSISESLKKLISGLTGMIGLPALYESGQEDHPEDLSGSETVDGDSTADRFDNQWMNYLAEDKTPDVFSIPISPVSRKTDHIFRHFLDSSFRYFLLSTGQQFPVILSQTATAILSRDENGNLSSAGASKDEKWLLFIHKAGLDETKLRSILSKSSLNIVVKDIGLADDWTSRTRFSVVERCRGIIRHTVNEFEDSLVAKFRQENPAGWIMKSGMISFGRFGTCLRFPELAGIAKTFTRIQKLYSAEGSLHVQTDLSDRLSEMPENHRTPAFFGYGGHSAFWYIRLNRNKSVFDSLYGIIKVELPVLDRQPLTTDLLNKLSGAILAEKSVSTYGASPDWHKQLYPMVQAKARTETLLYSYDLMQNVLTHILRSSPK